MNDNKVDQSNNEVGGHLAGRDVNEYKTLSFGTNKSKISPIQALYQKFKLEQAQNPQIRKIVEELENYRQNIDVEVVGLEQKLIDGNQKSSIEYAERAKEFFYKKLVKHEMSEVAQKINVHLLADIESRFSNHIRPKICSGTYQEEDIKTLIQELIITPVIDSLEDNTLEFTARDINGMLYFLTGNCHIKWTK